MLSLTYYMIYCFTLLATQPMKRGVHELVSELNIVCSQYLSGLQKSALQFYSHLSYSTPRSYLCQLSQALVLLLLVVVVVVVESGVKT